MSGIKLLIPATIDGLTGYAGGVAGAIETFADEVLIKKSEIIGISLEILGTSNPIHLQITRVASDIFIAFLKSEELYDGQLGWSIQLKKRVPDGRELGSEISSAVSIIAALNEVLLHSFEKKELISLVEKTLVQLDIPFNKSKIAACLSGGMMLMLNDKTIRVSIPRGLSLLFAFKKTDNTTLIPVDQDHLIAWIHGMFLTDFDLIKEGMQFGVVDKGSFEEIVMGAGALGSGNSFGIHLALFHNSLNEEQAIKDLSLNGFPKQSIFSTKFNVEGVMKA
jgi:hypothetical protein